MNGGGPRSDLSDMPWDAPMDEGEQLARQPPYRVQSFWSPCRKYIVNACVSDNNITLLDDDGRIWEPTGPEEDVAHPDYLKRSALRRSPDAQ